jgi:hypothetical protein
MKNQLLFKTIIISFAAMLYGIYKVNAQDSTQNRYMNGTYIDSVHGINPDGTNNNMQQQMRNKGSNNPNIASPDVDGVHDKTTSQWDIEGHSRTPQDSSRTHSVIKHTTRTSVDSTQHSHISSGQKITTPASNTNSSKRPQDKNKKMYLVPDSTLKRDSLRR